jgi:hypothetical protein
MASSGNTLILGNGTTIEDILGVFTPESSLMLMQTIYCDCHEHRETLYGLMVELKHAPAARRMECFLRLEEAWLRVRPIFHAATERMMRDYYVGICPAFMALMETPRLGVMYTNEPLPPLTVDALRGISVIEDETASFRGTRDFLLALQALLVLIMPSERRRPPRAATRHDGGLPRRRADAPRSRDRDRSPSPDAPRSRDRNRSPSPTRTRRAPAAAQSPPTGSAIEDHLQQRLADAVRLVNQLEHLQSSKGSTPILREAIGELQLKEWHMRQQLACIRNRTQRTTDEEV